MLPAKNSGTAAATKPIVYLISLRVSPGMMNAQICHSQIGAEIRMPIANDMRRRRSNAPVTVLNMSSTFAESPSSSAI